jgi:hypothetical protein
VTWTFVWQLIVLMLVATLCMFALLGAFKNPGGKA